MFSFILCNSGYHIIPIPERRTKVSTKSGGVARERSDERSQTNLGSCLSKVKEQREREANHREADKNLSLTFRLLREELYS